MISVPQLHHSTFCKGIFITHDPITLQLNSKGPIRCTMHNNFVFVPENANSSSKWGAFLVSLLSLLALWVVWLSSSFSTGLITFLHSSRLNRDAVTSCEQLKPNKTTLRHKQRKKKKNRQGGRVIKEALTTTKDKLAARPNRAVWRSASNIRVWVCIMILQCVCIVCILISLFWCLAGLCITWLCNLRFSWLSNSASRH